MEKRDAHIKFPQQLTAEYKAVSDAVPSISTNYYNNLAKNLLQRQIVQVLQAILATQSTDWAHIRNIAQKYPQPSELNFALNQLTFLDINCGSGTLLTALVRAWVQAKMELSLLFYADGRKISQIEMKIIGDELQCWDLRDNTLREYYAPNLVRRVTYQHALTGKTTVVEEGKIKSETQLLQEAIFGEKKRFLQTQVYAASGNLLHVTLTKQAFACELAKHLYYTIETDYRDLAELPDFQQNVVYGNPLQSRFPAEMAWAFLGKKEKDWENLLALRTKTRETNDVQKQHTYQKQAKKLQQKICEIAIRHDERFDVLQKMKATFHQKYALNTLFEVEIGYETAHEKADLATEIEKIERSLGLQENDIPLLDWALAFPELSDAQGIFQGANVVLADFSPEMLPDLPRSNQKFAWKNAHYQRFCEQILTKSLLSAGYATLILPATFLQKNDAAELRTHLLENMNLQAIGDISREKCYVMAQNTPIFSAEIPIFDAETGEIKYKIGRKFISPQANYAIEIDLPIETQSFIFEIEKECFLLASCAEIVRGISISQKNMTENEGIKLIKGKDISPFHIHFQQRYMPIDFAEWQQRKSEFTGENWVYVTFQQGKLVATLSESTFLFSKEIYGIKLSPEISKYYVAAWLNSAIYQRYVAFTFGAISTQNLLNILEKTPLKRLSTERLSEIENAVKEIVMRKNGGEEVEKDEEFTFF